MKKIFSILGSLLFITAVKAQTTVVKKETVNPGSSQTTGTAASSKDPKLANDPKKEEAERIAAQRAAKDAKLAQHVDPKTLPVKDPKAVKTDPKKEEAERLAAQRAAKDAKIAQHVDPKKAEAEKLAAQRAAKDAKVAQHLDTKALPIKDAKEIKNANTQHKEN